jgi:hypothetical protein
MTVYRPVGIRTRIARGSFFGQRRRIVTVVVGAVLAAGLVFFVVPRIVGLGPTLRRLRGGGIGWLALGVGLDAFSMLGDIVMFRGAFAARETPLGWRRTWDIQMACYMLVTIRGLPARPRGRGIRTVAGAVRRSGAGRSHADSGERRCRGDPCRPVDAAPRRANRATRRRRAERSTGRTAGRWRRAATLPRTVHSGLLAALDMVRRRDRSLLGAVAYLGVRHRRAVGMLSGLRARAAGGGAGGRYDVGTLGNALPIPRGIGGVEGGMIGAFLGCGVTGSVATLAVLGCRTISNWRPTGPGAIAYFHLRGRHGTPSTGEHDPTE